VNGPTHNMTLGEIPASKRPASTTTVPKKILTG